MTFLDHLTHYKRSDVLCLCSYFISCFDLCGNLSYNSQYPSEQRDKNPVSGYRIAQKHVGTNESGIWMWPAPDFSWWARSKETRQTATKTDTGQQQHTELCYNTTTTQSTYTREPAQITGFISNPLKTFNCV